MRRKEAEDLGGEDSRDDFDFKNLRYCDKGGHKERSIASSPQHREHWKKEKQKHEDWTLPKIRVTI
jgi:hypothetical protein